MLNNEKYYPKTIVDDKGKLQPQAAAVLAEPETGHIKALVGGRDYGTHNQDLRFLSSRQPGSSTKPVLTYAPAMEEKILFPGSVLDDAPADFGNYFPENYGLTFKGLVSVRESIVHSYNVPAVKAYSMVTPKVGMDYARKLGITTFDIKDEGILSLTLGGFTYGVRPIDMAQVFAVFSNKGVKIPLTTILKIENHLGQEIYSYNPKPEIVLSETTAYLITDVLKDVAQRGTAGRLSGVGRPIAAKTGTTSDNKDGWLVSYTPDYVLSTWIGYDLLTMGSIMNAPRYPINMSIDIMKKVHEGLSKRDFTSPGGISRVTICSKSGLRPSEHCPEEHITSDLFPRGYEPRETCNVHVSLKVCAESGLLSTEFCPEVEEKSFIQRLTPYTPTDHRWKGGTVGRVPADAALEAPAETCDIHTERSLGPAGLTLSSSPDGKQVTLSWYHPDTSNIAGYIVYRKTADGDGDGNGDENGNGDEYKRLNQQLITVNIFIDKNVKPETSYDYKVTAVNINGVESLPVLGSITTNKLEPVPPDPPSENGDDNGDENGEGENGNDNNNGNQSGRGNRNPPKNTPLTGLIGLPMFTIWTLKKYKIQNKK